MAKYLLHSRLVFAIKFYLSKKINVHEVRHFLKPRDVRRHPRATRNEERKTEEKS